MLLNEELTYLKGVGPNKARLLESELSLRSIGDLLFIFPFRYVDKTRITPIKDLDPSIHCQVVGTLIKKNKVRGQKQSYHTGTLKDSSGFLELIWFRAGAWLDDLLVVDKQYLIYGKPQRFKGCLLYTSPSPRDQRGSRMPSSA